MIGPRYRFLIIVSVFIIVIPVIARALTVHVYQPGSKAYLEYRGAVTEKYRTARMLNERSDWKFSQFLPDNIRFHIRPEYGKNVSLGLVPGESSGTCSGDFSSGSQELWLKDALLYPYNPDHDRPEGYLTVLTLNMHTYQEQNQYDKFLKIAEAISRLKPDIVCLQECAQDKSAPVIATHHGEKIRSDNMALIITTTLRNNYAMNYDFYWNWSHYGWNRWEEGCAILSAYSFNKVASRYVSENESKDFWKSRNVVFGELATPAGAIQVFSNHLGWWNDNDEPYRQQFDRLVNWQAELADSKTVAALLCGDFNETAGSEGYYYSLKRGKLIDCYLKSIPEGMYDATIGGKIDGWADSGENGKRIDYIFVTEDSRIQPVLAQRIFTDDCYGSVSDHSGVYVHFRYK